MQFNVYPSSFSPDDSSSVPTEAENNELSEATPLAHEEEGFALEPVVVMRRPKHLLYSGHFGHAV